jgi:lysophospholipase L1-like esterase
MDGRWPGHHPELFRLMFVGDSFTAGQGVHTGKEFAVQVADALRDKAPSRELQLLNHSKPGMDFTTEYIMFRDYSANYAPDVVVWVFVLNDLTHDFNVGLVGFDDYIIDRTRYGFKPSWSRAWDFVRLCLRRYRAGKKMEQAYRKTFNPEKNGKELQLFESRLAEMVREIRSRGARFVFVVFPLLIDFEDYPFRQAHKTLVQLASRAGAETLDLLPYFEKINEHKLWASSDDHHPNAYGHRIAAEAITYHLTEGELPAAGPRSCQVRRQGDATRVQELLQAGLREEAYNLARELACTFPDSPEVALVMAKCYLAVSEARRKHYTYWTLAAVHLLQARVLAAGLAQGEREEIESRVDKLLSEMVAIVGL